MKSVVMILVALMCFSCITTKKIQKHCPEFAAICVVDREVHIDTIIEEVEIVLRDTIEVPLPQDTVVIETPVYVTDGMANSERLTVRNGLVGATAWVTDNQLNVHAFIADSSLMINRIDTVTVEKEIITESKSTVVEIIPDWYKWLVGGFALLLVIVAVLIVWTLKKV